MRSIPQIYVSSTEEEGVLDDHLADFTENNLIGTHISQCIEVRPKYLIPDTNCFIDFLDHLRALENTRNSYLLLVPTIG